MLPRTAPNALVLGLAVHYAHQRGVLHRDIKPANILIDAQGSPHLTDFGLAKVIHSDRTITHTHAVLGTPAYMAPEQARGQTRDVTTAADIYGIGTVLYEALTGSPPFAGGTSAATIQLVLEQEARPPSALNELVDADLDTICLKCIEKSPHQRYSSADAIVQDLSRWLQNEPIQARLCSRWERAKRWAQRKPAIAALAAALAIVASAGLAGILWQWRNAIAARYDAVEQRIRVEAALSRIEIEDAEHAFSVDDTTTALAHLARQLRRDPRDHVATDRLVTTLTWNNFCLPIVPPIQVTEQVTQLKFSPDGYRFVVVHPGSLQVWDVTGRALTPLMRNPDFVASNTPEAQVADSIALVSLTETAPHDVQPVEFSRNSQWLTAANGTVIRIWNSFTGEMFKHPIRAPSPVRAVQFTPDEQGIMIGCTDGHLRSYNFRTGQLVSDTIRQSAAITTIQISPDEKQILTASAHGAIQLWNISTGHPVGNPIPNDQPVASMRFSPDGQQILVVLANGTVSLWSIDGQPLRQVKHQMVLCAEFSESGDRVLGLLPPDGRIRDLFDSVPLTEPSDPDAVLAALSRNGKRLLTAQSSETSRSGKIDIQIWDAHPGHALPLMIQLDPRTKGVIGDARFSPKGDRLITQSGTRDGNKTAHIWDIENQRLQPSSLNDLAFASVLFSWDGRFVAAIFIDRSAARVWDLGTGHATGPTMGPGLPIESACFSPTADHLVIAAGNSAFIFNFRSGEQLITLPHAGPVSHVDLSFDGKLAVTAVRDQTHVWRLSDRHLLHTITHTSQIRSLHCSRHTLEFAVACAEGTLETVDLNSGKFTGPIIRTGNSLHFVKFSGNNERCLISDAQSFAVWNMQTRELQFDPLRPSTPFSSTVVTETVDLDGVRSGQRVHWANPYLDFSEDGTRLIERSTGNVRDARTGKVIAALASQLLAISCLNDAGDRLATVSDAIAIWEIHSFQMPAPDWLPELAEVLAGKRLTVGRLSERVERQKLLKIQQQIQAMDPSTRWAKWGRWFFADRTSRAPRPPP